MCDFFKFFLCGGGDGPFCRSIEEATFAVDVVAVVAVVVVVVVVVVDGGVFSVCVCVCVCVFVCVRA